MTPRAWAAFAAVSVLWGIPYLFIKIAVDDGVSPVFLAWSRVVLGAAVLLALAHRAGTLRDARPHLGVLAVYAVIEICIPWPLIGEGERHISSSLTAILIAAVPLNVALLALRFEPSERVEGRRLAGLLAGFAGVVALVGLDVAGERDELIGAGLVLVASVLYAIGPMILNRHLRAVDPRAAQGAALAIAAVVLLVPAGLTAPSETPGTGALAAIVVLGLLCTAAAMAFFGFLINEVGPGRAAIITYVAPVVALALGVVALDERPGVGSLVGLVLIVGGSWLATRGRRPAPEPMAPA